ncbi:hypothetical protein [Nocardioides korecus]
MTGGKVQATLVATIGFLAGDGWHILEGHLSRLRWGTPKLVNDWVTHAEAADPLDCRVARTSRR